MQGWSRLAWNAMAAFSKSVPSSGNQTGAALWISFVMSRCDSGSHRALAAGNARSASRGGVAVQRVAGQAAIPAASLGVHVERRRGHALPHRGLDAGQPEREAGVLDAVGVQRGVDAGRVRAGGRGIARVARCPWSRSPGAPPWRCCPRSMRTVWVAETVVVAILGTTVTLPGIRRHRLAGKRDNRRDGRAGHNLAVRQGARAAAGTGRPRACRPAARRASGVEAARGDLERRPGLEHVVDTPQLPHALGEVRIEVAVEDGVAGALVPVTRRRRS